MDIWSLTWFAVGASLTLGGALAVARGADAIGRAIGASAVLRGLTVVALAAALPELACVHWASKPDFDLSDLALGDLLGSVTANYLLALALGALAAPLVVSPRIRVFAFPLAIVAALFALAAGRSGEFGSGAAGLLLPAAFLWPFVAALVGRMKANESKRRTKRHRGAGPPPSEVASPSPSGRSTAVAIAGIAVGATAVYSGPRLFLEPATELAQRFGLDDLSLGLTALAALTTSPEAVLCLAAGLRGDRETGAAVVVGSSLFNLTAGLGTLALASPTGLVVSPLAFEFALPAAIAATLACVPSFYGMRSLSRASGLVLFAFYLAFVVYLLVGESARGANAPAEPDRSRLYAMFLLTIGLIATTSVIATIEGLIRKARLADE